MHFKAQNTDDLNSSYTNFKIRSYVQSLVEYQTLNAYSEKSIPTWSGPFSQSLSHMSCIGFARLIVTTTYIFVPGIICRCMIHGSAIEL